MSGEQWRARTAGAEMILGRADVGPDDLKKWLAEIKNGLGEVVGTDLKTWTEQYRHWDRTYVMCRVSQMLTGDADWKAKIRAVFLAVRYGNLIGLEAQERVKREVNAEVLLYVGEEGFRKLTEGGDGDIEEMIRYKLIKDPVARRKAEDDLAYRRRKIEDATLRDQAIVYLRAHPGGIFVDADGDRWHWDGFRRLDQTGPLPDLILTLRTRRHGISSRSGVWIPRPAGWVRPAGLD